MIINVILGIALIVAVIIIISYKLQIISISKEIDLIIKNKTNKVVSSEILSVQVKKLTSIEGYLDLLKNCDNEDDKERYYKILSTRVDSLKEILFYEDLTSRGIEPKITLAKMPCKIVGNEPALRRAIQNVIKNALEHGEENLFLTLGNDDKKVWIIIENTCSNEDEIDIDKVFNRFYKADKSRTHTSTGLGLAIAQKLVLKMNGNIEAMKNDNKFGIKMTFDLMQV